MKTVNLFVYGTLMPSGHNDHFGLAESAKEHHEAIAFGEMYNRSGVHPVYPVVNFDGANEILGVVMTGIPVNSEALQSAHSMEVGAGYEVRNIKVTTASGEVLEAIAYHFDTSDEYGIRKVGVRIDSGSWYEFMARAYGR